MCQIVLVCWRVSQFLEFPRISGLCQKLAQPQNLLEKLGEAYSSNFLTAMLDLKCRIKAGTAKTGATQFLNGVFLFFDNNELYIKLRTHLLVCPR